MSHKKTGYRNVYRRGRIYHFRFHDETGRRIERRYGENLTDAVQAQAKAQREANAITHGLTTRAKLDAQISQHRPFLKTLDEYIEHLESAKNSRGHIKAVRHHCELIANAFRWKTLDDINAAEVDAALVQILKDGRSNRARNDYLVKLQGFVNWCVDRRGYLQTSTLRMLHTVSASADPRRPVRALSPDEFSKLIKAAPARRKLAYWLAGGLGLRWTEIRKVRWSQVDLKGGWIILPASISKNRKDSSVPMPATVIASLRTIPVKKQNGEVCPHPPILRTFKLDVAKAKIKTTEAGAVHRRSLRKTFITHLAISGVDLRTAQRLARHSRPELTSNIYTDPHLLDMRGAMEKLGGLQSKSGKSVAKGKGGNRKKVG